jgi:Holliday junction resolvase-like predicted endonuclease
MTQERLTLGRQSVGAALRCLQNQGMKIVERNLLTPV